MMKLVLLRHGESLANKENVFTGWLEEPLTETGIHEAELVGAALGKSGIQFHSAHTSVQNRAIKTTNIVLESIHQLYLPVHKTWRLNERHYGGIQGKNKAETAQRFGKKLVNDWRRSYAIRPPQADSFTFDRRYRLLDTQEILLGESLEDTLMRLLPYWEDVLVPELLTNKNVLVVSHGNTLRALVKYLENISAEAIEKLIIYNGELMIYDLDEQLNIISKETFIDGKILV